jgi:hypothetical protein
VSVLGARRSSGDPEEVAALGIANLFPASTGDPLSEWLSEWLAGDEQRDNIDKLASSGADERHLFVVVPTYADGPFAATVMLLSDDAPLGAATDERARLLQGLLDLP